MKIGIVTIFNVPNYGAMLQCYSLCKFLEKNGHTPILFRIPFPADPIKKTQLTFDFIYKKFSRDFVKKHLAFTNDLTTEVDAYLVGSDQVWNTDIVGDNWRNFMLAFAPDNKPKFSYGSSFGYKTWNKPQLKSDAKKLLERFDSVTVREDSGVDLLKTEFGIEAYRVLDPCFLNDDFNELVTKDVTNKNTLVSFQLSPAHEPWKPLALKLAQSLNCQHVDNSMRWRLPVKKGLRGINIKYLPVADWIMNIASSRFVITDSFHGMVLAIMYQKQFAVFDNGSGRFNRLQNLLESINLSDRIAANFDDARRILQTSIDYSLVRSKLETIQFESRDRLLNDISRIKKNLYLN